MKIERAEGRRWRIQEEEDVNVFCPRV